MGELAIYFLGFMTTVCGILYLLIPKFKWAKLSPIYFMIMLLWGFAFFDKFSGFPKVEAFEWRAAEEVEVLAYSFNEPVAIYLWLMRKEEIIPIAYSYDWNLEFAQKVYQAFKNKQEHEGVFMKKDSQNMWSPMVKDQEPQTPLPPKESM